MLVELTVENVAIIERSQLTLGPGFTAITGETGAGKSLLVDAIGLALGERADSELVRHGAAKGQVSLVVDLTDQPELFEVCQELGIELEEGQLFIQREISSEGRSACRINGRLAPVNILKQVGLLIADLHGQHEHQALLDPGKHIYYLDAWIGEPALELAKQVKKAYDALQQVQHELDQLHQNQRDREYQLDLLRFQVQEIQLVNPRPGELEALEAQLIRLQSAEQLATYVFSALENLRDTEGSALDRIISVIKDMEIGDRLDPRLNPILQTLYSSLYALEDSLTQLKTYANDLETEPSMLEEVAGRVDMLKRLRKKYGQNEEAILAYLDQARLQLNMLENAEASEENLLKQHELLSHELSLISSKLSDLRKDNACKFDEHVKSQLVDLGLGKASFKTNFSLKVCDSNGNDNVEFYFTANIGEPLRPFAKIASGGELSRLMLALKVVLAGKAGVPTMIFDEIDVGLGGQAAARLAKKLEELSHHYQVIVISHLPQVASRATSHARIEKEFLDNRMITSVRWLNEGERVEEIARMLAGETISESAMANARDLLAGRIMAL